MVCVASGSKMKRWLRRKRVNLPIGGLEEEEAKKTDRPGQTMTADEPDEE